jgi:hypothetical protein
MATHEAEVAQRGMLARERLGEKCIVSRLSKPKPHATGWLISHAYPCFDFEHHIQMGMDRLKPMIHCVFLGEYPCSRFISRVPCV